MTPFIQFDRVMFGYSPERLVLRDVSFSVGRGDVVAVMGGSGSGKTTLLRLLMGQEFADSGRVLIDGEDLKGFGRKKLAEFRKRMGALFQDGALFGDMTVSENVMFPLREHTALPERALRDLAALKLRAVGLGAFGDYMPAQLSGGMARRAALARAMALDPELMLFDEPFSGLDPVSLGQIAELIALAGRALRATCVMVTHDVARSLDVCSKAIFLHEGKIAFEGAPEAMRASTSPLIAGFLSGKGGLDFAPPTTGPETEAETKSATRAPETRRRSKTAQAGPQPDSTPSLGAAQSVGPQARPDDQSPNIKEGRP